ncbi:MAG TPA: hypothetical protein VGC13_04380 [Longimicrobium sp.]
MTLLELAPLLSSIAASISAIAAFSAVRLNRRAQKELRETKEAERLASLYKHVVMDHVQDYLREFRTTTVEMLAAGIGDLSQMIASNTQIGPIKARSTRLIKELKENWEVTGSALLAGAEPFDSRVYDALEAAIEEVTDEVTGLIVQHVGALEEESGAEPRISIKDFRRAIQKHTVRINSVMIDNHPTVPRRPERALPAALPPVKPAAALPPAASPSGSRALPSGRSSKKN